MKQPQRIVRLALSPLAVLACAALAQAQEPEKPKLTEVGREALGQGRDEMIELFHKVERRLDEIDRLLYDASTGTRKLEAQQESGIGELLKSSTQKSQEVVRDIDRILEIAAKNGGT